VDVGVDGSGGRDEPLAGHDGGPGAHDDVDPVKGVGVPGPPDRADPAFPDADGDLTDPQRRVDHDDVADDQVTGLPDGGRLEVQPVAGGLAEPGEELVAVALRVGLDADRQAGVAQPDPVARARAVGGGVLVRAEAAGVGGVASWAAHRSTS
jgi:hypothetical protein